MTTSHDAAEAFRASASHFPTALQQFQFFDKYSRFDYSKGRRETFRETVTRSVDYLYDLAGSALPQETYTAIENAMLKLDVIPSMRLMAMAGPAAKRNNITIYNCSYMPVDDLRAFPEALIISMSGCGVGFSVEHQYVDRLPLVAPQRDVPRERHEISDTSEGWAEAITRALTAWWLEGRDIKFDFSAIRPAGAPLITKGGRASGPDPLKFMLQEMKRIILARQGAQMRSIDVHDIMCLIGGAAVSGGMRRTAMISLFSADDPLMMQAKSGDIGTTAPWRWNANNSIVWDNYDESVFHAAFDEMIASGNGEPGLFSRTVARNLAPERRALAEFGTNPCGEILLRPMQLCNLSAAVARADDTMATLTEKVRLASIIGTIQSLATHFPGLRPEWKRNCEEERLLGVDINGQMDCPAVRKPEVLRYLKDIAVRTNAKTAALLGINASAAVTCVKPSGNSSQLLNCSSGLHARWSPYYIRNVRVSTHSPLFGVLRDAGVPMDPENGQTAENATTYVVHFPVKAPKEAIVTEQLSAIDQCEYWLTVKREYTEHNPSCTITYRPEEAKELRKWVWEHRDMIGGLSFLPAFDAKYAQMPYEKIGKTWYHKLLKEFPPIDFSRIMAYEDHDMTSAAQELACVAGACEIDLPPEEQM